mmetsp:Transcript_72292/g.130089  ORF Transcript_72292/g.130089 Transcript_72292/m.130089 type:complete len:262 (-) Transcript_72292:12-797(-)
MHTAAVVLPLFNFTRLPVQVRLHDVNLLLGDPKLPLQSLHQMLIDLLGLVSLLHLVGRLCELLNGPLTCEAAVGFLHLSCISFQESDRSPNLYELLLSSVSLPVDLVVLFPNVRQNALQILIVPFLRVPLELIDGAFHGDGELVGTSRQLPGGLAGALPPELRSRKLFAFRRYPGGQRLIPCRPGEAARARGWPGTGVLGRGRSSKALLRRRPGLRGSCHARPLSQLLTQFLSLELGEFRFKGEAECHKERDPVKIICSSH